MQIVRNHLIPRTLSYFALEKITETGVPARYKSLGEAVWEFEFFTTEGAVDGTVVLVDTYNVTQERAEDILFLQWDIANSKAGEWCARPVLRPVLPCSEVTCPAPREPHCPSCML